MTKKTVLYCRMPFKTKFFNKNQKVWAIKLTGAQAFYCAGKFRGKWKYVKAWISWSKKHRECPEWKVIDVDAGFAARLSLATTGLEYFIEQEKAS